MLLGKEYVDDASRVSWGGGGGAPKLASSPVPLSAHREDIRGKVEHFGAGGGSPCPHPCGSEIYCATYVVQSFIKGYRKSGVISIEHSRDITIRISPLRVE